MAEKANEITGVEQYAVRAFGDALDSVAMALAENSGLNAVEAIGEVKARQVIGLKQQPKKSFL